jgi:hypothetical protein
MTTRDPSRTRPSTGRKRRSPAIALVPMALLVGVAGGAASAGGDDVTIEIWTHEFEPLQVTLGANAFTTSAHGASRSGR